MGHESPAPVDRPDSVNAPLQNGPGFYGLSLREILKLRVTDSGGKETNNLS